MATGKDQKITITSSSGLSKEDVERMAKEAEVHAADDKGRREEIEPKNLLDAMIYNVEKMLRHLGGVGVFILAALDSSVLPTLGAVDALTIVLAARHPELWSYYAMCRTRSAGLLSLTACCTWSPPSTY